MVSTGLKRLLPVTSFLLLTFFFLADPSLSQTSLLSDEEIPRLIGFTFGVETGVTSRDVLDKDVPEPGFNFQGDAVSTRLLARIGLKFFDRVEIYGKGGGADLSVSEFDDYDARLAPAYGGGLHVDLYQGARPDRIKIFLDGSFLYFVTKDIVQALFCLDTIDPGQNCGDTEFIPRMVDEKIRWREGTILAGGSFRHDYFEPYGGVRLSFVRGDDKLDFKVDNNFSNPDHRDIDLEEDDNFGIFFGTNIYLDRNEKSAISLEVSAIDQFAFTAGFKVNF